MKIWGVVGWKNAGKTGLMERLVAEFVGRGHTVSTIKHAHHTFDVDHARQGQPPPPRRRGDRGAALLAHPLRAACTSTAAMRRAVLEDLIAKITPVDLLLVEGYKRDRHPKVEAHRAETGNPLIAPGDDTIRAIASDTPLDGHGRPVFDLNDTRAIADFIAGEVGL